MLGNRTRLRRGEAETHYRYDAASHLLGPKAVTAAPNTGTTPVGWSRRSRARTGTTPAEGAGEEHDRDRRTRAIACNGFGQPVSVTRTWHAYREHLQAAYSGDALLASLVLTA